jgi:hypothetical protein
MSQDYDIRLDDKFGHLNLIDIGAEAAANEPWFNQTLTTVNDVVVRLGVIDGDFHWHKHDDTDEFFSSWMVGCSSTSTRRPRSRSTRNRASPSRAACCTAHAPPSARRSS